MDHRVASGATSPAYCTGIINTPSDAWKQAKVSFASLNGLDHNWGSTHSMVELCINLKNFMNLADELYNF